MTEGIARDVDWLPGGCILHYKNQLITSNFYPLDGKAFCEDLMHSLFLRRNGTRLNVTKKARVMCDTTEVRFSFEQMKRDVLARVHFLRLQGRVPARFWLWAIVSSFRRAITYLKS